MSGWRPEQTTAIRLVVVLTFTWNMPKIPDSKDDSGCWSAGINVHQRFEKLHRARAQNGKHTLF